MVNKIPKTIEVEKNVLYSGSDLFSFGPFDSPGLLLFNLMQKYDSRVALIDGVTGDEVTFKQLLNASVETAKCLIEAGLKIGDTIGLVSENRLEFPIPLLAAIFIGVTVAPANPTYTERELTHAFGLSRPKFIFTSPAASHSVARLASQTSYIQKVIQFGNKLLNKNTMLFRDFIKQYKQPHQTTFSPVVVNVKEHTALIVCSSGTTGLPKGVQITHFNLLTTFGLFRDLLPERIQNVDDIIVLGVLPFFHVFGCFVVLGSCAYGGKLVSVPKFEETNFLSCIEKYKISVLYTVPPLMIFLAKHPLVDKYDLSSVKLILCGAAPLSGETAEAVTKRLKYKATITQAYGMSEVTLVAIRHKSTEFQKMGSTGTLSPGTYCKVVDVETGKILGKHQAGEIHLKGPQVMKGYIGNDDATRNTIDKDGWLHTGDVGYYDDDYHFYIVDRLKELIKYKGFQVPPAELESVLLTNPKIKDAAVVGLPDEASGELPLAFVVAQPNAKLTEEEVIKYVEGRVSSAKRLRGGVRFLDAIPKNPSGKILRRELRALLARSKL